MGERPHYWRISDSEGWKQDVADARAEKELKKMTPDRSTCKVCMADLASDDPHEGWCTLA